ncbi:helix-turn-helix domain-containing protein [Nosocomiicoccus massiliensis]|uniref:Helix-turn-helix domain-containing protein n=1 Tax=Nosocomiicoccus massiliensis TaxID=1232430 RepID=A0AAF1BSF9_9STAP|nr:helix-turn-helix domain-containing protein [Nosocomiicoccus massiliensis]WOS96923.1 helix-turn-helix domain-containing protein [Nosocomiicoccus massiliensis]
MDEVHRIKNIEDLKVLSDPFRVNILLTLGNVAKSGQELSKILNEKGLKIYYHLNELEKRGFIKVEKTEVVNGIVQKFYLPVAKAFIPDINIFSQFTDTTHENFSVKADEYDMFIKEFKQLIEKYGSNDGVHQFIVLES